MTNTYVHVCTKEELNQLLNAFKKGSWKPPFCCDDETRTTCSTPTAAPKEAKGTLIYEWLHANSIAYR